MQIPLSTGFNFQLKPGGAGGPSPVQTRVAFC